MAADFARARAAAQSPARIWRASIGAFGRHSARGPRLAGACWTALAFAYFVGEPSLALWTALVAAAALSTEGFFWVAAGVAGWSVLAGRRAMLTSRSPLLQARLLYCERTHP